MMSRAINVDLPRASVVAMCKKHAAAVSAVESLPDGATRVIMVNADGASTMRHAFRNKLLPDRAARFPQWDKRRA